MKTGCWWGPFPLLTEGAGGLGKYQVVWAGTGGQGDSVRVQGVVCFSKDCAQAHAFMVSTQCLPFSQVEVAELGAQVGALATE